MPAYLIRGPDGDLRLRQTAESARGSVLHFDDQAFADAIASEIQQACRYFYEAETPPYPGCPEIEGVSDDEVRERVARIDREENTREALRMSKKRYPLTEMPFERQRALIERVERLKAHWEFRRLTDEEAREWQRAHAAPMFSQKAAGEDEEPIAYG